MNRLLSNLTVAALAFGSASIVSGSFAASASASAPAMPAAKVSAADKEFFTKAAQGGHAEIESSKLAVSKSASAEVKTFAQQMVTDHSKAGEELAALATTKGVTVPTSPSPAQQAQIKALDGAKGPAFDQRYAKVMGVEAHRQTVALFKKASAGAKDPDVKAFASKTLPTLEHHLKMAEDLNKSVGSK